MIYLTASASAYLENVWAWTADHDLDSATSAQVSVFTARGMLIESTNPVWLYGTAVEHATFYQYTFNEASNIAAGMIQTESPYYQPVPAPPAPYASAVGAITGDDPTLLSCSTSAEGCDASWALRIIESSNITIAGAGLYTWFSNYVQSLCVDGQNCQQTQVQVKNANGGVYIYNLITIGAVNMISESSPQESFRVPAGINTNMASHPYWSLITYFQPFSTPNDGGAQGGNGNNIYLPPSIWSSANPVGACLPPCTLIWPPYPLSAPSTISWPALITTLLSTSASTTYTITTTISITPVVITVIEWWAVTIYATDTNLVTYTLEQSVMPPPFVLTLPANENTFLPSQDPQYSLGTPISSTSSSTGVLLPLFTAPHTVTIQPQPTISISTPPPNVPTVTYTSGKPSSTCTANCGHHDCGLFGCGHGCGIFGCGGGCGIFRCGGGGCGLFGCGCFGRCGGGLSPCPLAACGGLGCASGSCGDGGGGPDPQSDCTPKTVTDCLQYCAVLTKNNLPTTSCTSSTCFPVIGCSTTGTTSTVTSTTTDYCPVVTPGTPPLVDSDVMLVVMLAPGLRC